jgi:hypothetical protein
MRRYAKGRRHVPGVMNKTEEEYANLFLRGRYVHGFEEITLKLAPACTLTIDFWVLADDMVLEFHEVKGGGGWTDDARVKMKVAADKFPHFRFRAFQKLPKKKGGEWVEEKFGPADLAA